MNSSMLNEISVQNLKLKLDHQEDFVLIDVREPEEYALCHIQTAQLIPLDRIADKLKDLDKDKTYVLMCRSGARSGVATQLFLENGFINVCNLVGGINQWAADIDSSILAY